MCRNKLFEATILVVTINLTQALEEGAPCLVNAARILSVLFLQLLQIAAAGAIEEAVLQLRQRHRLRMRHGRGLQVRAGPDGPRQQGGRMQVARKAPGRVPEHGYVSARYQHRMASRSIDMCGVFDCKTDVRVPEKVTINPNHFLPKLQGSTPAFKENTTEVHLVPTQLANLQRISHIQRLRGRHRFDLCL